MLQEFKSFREQAELMLQRGISGSVEQSKDDLIKELERNLRFINYYRLSAYWYPFRQTRNEKGVTITESSVIPGTKWIDVRNLYMFDRRLRQLIFDAIARIEIALRTQLAHVWAKQTGRVNPQGRTNSYKNSFDEIQSTLELVDGYYSKSKTDWAIFGKKGLCISHAKDLPVWVFVEFTTFGNLEKLLTKGLKRQVVREIAHNMGIDEADFFLSGVKLLKDVRNTCAHQGRIWNTRWLSKNKDAILRDPSSDTLWEQACADSHPLLQGKDKTAAVLTFCNVILQTVAPNSQWGERVVDLIQKTNIAGIMIPKAIGFNSSLWYQHPLWNIATVKQTANHVQ